jgi:hypothetical protein
MCEAKVKMGKINFPITIRKSFLRYTVQKINTNAAIAVNSDVDCNLNRPVQKPLFTASSILKLYSGIEV